MIICQARRQLFTIPRFGICLLAVFSLAVSSCAAPDPPPTGTIHRAALTMLSPAELYDLAVHQYRQLFDIIAEVNAQNGAPQLPESVRDYLVEPAWRAFNDVYSTMYIWGDYYVGQPDYQITTIAPLSPDEETFGAVVAIQSCELFQGAALVSRDGFVFQDGSPVIQSIKSYFLIEDQALKVFISNSEVVQSCPIT